MTSLCLSFLTWKMKIIWPLTVVRIKWYNAYKLHNKASSIKSTQQLKLLFIPIFERRSWCPTPLSSLVTEPQFCSGIPCNMPRHRGWMETSQSYSYLAQIGLEVDIWLHSSPWALMQSRLGASGKDTTPLCRNESHTWRHALCTPLPVPRFPALDTPLRCVLWSCCIHFAITRWWLPTTKNGRVKRWEKPGSLIITSWATEPPTLRDSVKRDKQMSTLLKQILIVSSGICSWKHPKW